MYAQGKNSLGNRADILHRSTVRLSQGLVSLLQKRAWKDASSFGQAFKHKHLFPVSSTAEGNAEDQMLSMLGSHRML